MPKKYKMTPTEDLFLETLAARIRLGESIWTFQARHRQTAEKLANLGIVGWKSGIVEDSILVWFTDRGKAECLSFAYIPPIAEDSKKVTARAKEIYENAQSLRVKLGVDDDEELVD